MSRQCLLAITQIRLATKPRSCQQCPQLMSVLVMPLEDRPSILKVMDFINGRLTSKSMESLVRSMEKMLSL
jgi:hypothetical protein